jgi:hypothetical protein
MKIYVEYFFRVWKHKYYVMRAGLKIGVSVWQLIVHDWHKFTPAEFVPYARYFCGGKNEDDKDAFMYAWLNHARKGKHHWEYWILNSGYDFSRAQGGLIPMPEKYIIEMVADWMGASMAYTGSWNMQLWLMDNLQNVLDNMNDLKTSYLIDVLICQGYNLKFISQRHTTLYYLWLNRID